MAEKTSLEVFRRVYDDTEGVYIQVGPDADGLGCVEVWTNAKEAEDYFGKIRFAISPGYARLVGKAMIECADELESNKK